MNLDKAVMVDAIIVELKRQSETTGCATETNGRFAEVDGSFDLELLAAAIIDVIGRQTN